MLRNGRNALEIAVMGTVLLAAVLPKAEAATNITETVDLAGQRVVFNEQLTGDGAFVNSSEDQATLVINVGASEPRANFGGTISGNIRVEVLGPSSQAFTSPGNTYTGGTYIERGYLYVATCDDIGTGPLELTRNGRLVLSGTRNAGDYSGTVNRVLTNRVVVTGTGRLGVYSDQSLTVACDLVMTNATLELWNDGIFNWKVPFTAENAGGGTLCLKDARMVADPGVFGSDSEHVVPMTIRLEDEGGNAPSLSFSGDAAVCVSNVVYAMKRKQSNVFTGSSPAVATGGVGRAEAWMADAGIKVFGDMTVAAYATNVQDGVFAIMPREADAVFNIPAGAKFTFSGLLSLPKGPDGRARGFSKRGLGTLVLAGGTDAAGTISVDAGTLEIGAGARLHDISALRVAPSARLVLDDGAVLPCPVSASDGGLAATADIWFDATAMTGFTDGATVSSVVNRGTAGGVFVSGTASGAPGLPKYAADGINGLPALSVNSGSGQPLGLCLDTYTNTATTITYFQVILIDSWNGSYNKWCTAMATGPSGESSTLDLWDTNRGFAYRFNNADRPTTFQIRNNDQNDTWDLGSKWPGVGTPICFSTRRNGAAKNHQAFWMDSGMGKIETKNSTAGGTAAFNINFVSLGAAAFQNGKAYTNRAFPGKIGEILVFTRALTDAEIATVNAYLRSKWFGYGTDGETFVAPSGQQVEVSVPEAARASLVPGFTQLVANATGSWVKTGPGTLALAGSATNCADLTVREGTLALVRGSTPSCASIWFDAADAATVTVTGEGLVGSVANKGSAGGRFVRSAGVTGLPSRVADGINGLPVVQFDFHSALTLASWTNNTANLPRNVHVYGVFKRTKYYLDEGSGTTLGHWAGPFSFYHSSETGDDNEVPGNFHWEEREATFPSGNADSIALWFGSDSTGLRPLDGSSNYRWTIRNTHFRTGDAFLLTSHQLANALSTTFETVADDPDAVALYATNAPTVKLSPFRCNLVQLGGRMFTGGVAQGGSANRMWHGQIGEFIVMDRLPTSVEDAAIVAYLRKKWLGKGDAPATPPACLAGIAYDVTESEGLALTMESGSTLEHAGSTLPLASLEAADAAFVRTTATADAATFALFDVSGAVTLSGALSFACDPTPSEDARLFRYGSLSDTAEWTVTAAGRPAAKTGNRAASSAYWLSVNQGTIIIFR